MSAFTYVGHVLICPDLKREAGKVDGRAESEAWREEGGEEEVAAVLGAAEALVRAVPRALRAPDPLGLPDHVIPHHLKENTTITACSKLNIEMEAAVFLIPTMLYLTASLRVKLLTCGIRTSFSVDYL